MPDTTYEYLQGVFNGEHPIQRQNPQPEESEYYYINPNQNPTKSVNELQTTDISNNVLQTAEGLTSAALNGLSAGFADEIEGGINGAGYAVGNMLGNNKQESIGEAFSRGYKEARDYRRNILKQTRKEHPIAYGIAEGVGSIANRVPLFKYSKTAPWWVKSSQIYKNNIAMSALDGYGNNENNNAKDVAVDASLGGISGMLGTDAGMRTFGRNTTRPLERSILNRLAGEGKKLLHNSLYGRTKE